MRADALDDPQRWVSRISLLPEPSRPQAISSLARAWAEQTPEDAIGWVASLPAGDSRSGAVAAVASAWAAKDGWSAATWVSSLAPGPDRDRSAGSLVFTVAEKFPRKAWDWALLWANRLPEGHALPAGGEAFAEWWRSQPETAMEWLNALPAADERQEMFFERMIRVLSHEPQGAEQLGVLTPSQRAAARNIIATMALSEDRRTQLLAALKPR